MPSGSRHLLIISCSQRKRPDPVPLPAMERYDGVNFRVLRKACREGYYPENLDVLILSAKYGFIGPDTLIEDYDCPMTIQCALALQPESAARVDACLAHTDYSEILINMGQTYLVALAQSSEIRRQAHKVRYATGAIGEKMSQMKRWLQKLANCAGVVHRER